MYKPSGTNSSVPRPYEAAHRQVARKAAVEGLVLLKNDNHALPLAAAGSVAVYGTGAIFTIKGGTGSGDVNARETVNIVDGIKNAGVSVANEGWLAEFAKEYGEARLAWRDEVWRRADTGERLFFAASETPFITPAGPDPVREDTDTAIYVIARTAGEAADRHNTPGDYQLTEGEAAQIRKLRGLYPKLILIINSGSLIELDFDGYDDIDAVLYVGQPGMEAGNAIADVLFGKASPSGKLTDTWPVKYADLSNADTFSYMSGLEREVYHEGIYVGYRYFDTFNVPVRYSFGYGLSYTEFDITPVSLTVNREIPLPRVFITAHVTNTGSCAGREVLQVYASCPGTRLDKEYRRLAKFKKTALLAPGESEDTVVYFSLYDLASYDEKLPGWVIEAGDVILYLGTSLSDAKPFATLHVKDEIVFSKTENICPPQVSIDELRSDAALTAARRAEDLKAAGGFTAELSSADFAPETITYGPAYDDTPAEVRDFVEALSVDQLVELATGSLSAGQGSTIGAAGSRVPGSAAQTSPCAAEQGLPDIVLADGPAGLRLTATYQLVDGYPKREPLEKALYNGFFYRGEDVTEGETWYQYTTAIPVGTVLAQTWDPEIVKMCGDIIGEEMNEFGVELWLAPGMNIHRNPLCGRNFEYYSEDPMLTSSIASAMAEGVEAHPGCGVTIKHFACNSQEDNRHGSDSILSERALREIYLKAFELTVRKSHPKSIMTSYNLVNGVHAANSYDLCTKAARNEWGFDGMIMTDWGTTRDKPLSTASGCMRAGNDIVMPGEPSDHGDIRASLEDGTLDIKDLKRSIARVVRCVWALTGR